MRAMIFCKSPHFLRLLAAAGLLCAACFVGSAQAEQALQIATQESLRPSTVMANHILAEAYRRLGISVSFIPLPNRRALQMADDGSADAISLRLVDDGRADLQKISVPIAYEDIVIFSTGKRFEVSGFPSLKPYVVGFITGLPYMEARLQGTQTDVAPNLESLFKMLDAGRTDVAIESRFSFCVAKKLGLNRIIILEPSLEKRLGYHFIHKRHQALIPRLESVLRSMEADGTIRRMQEEAVRDFMMRCTG